MVEIWRPIAGYEDRYEVSDHGQVRSLSRRIGSGGPGTRVMNGRIRKQSIGIKNGYYYVALSATDKRLVHRLVLEAFVGPCPDGMECCHNDNNRLNNLVSNLRWDTRYNNVQDTRAAGTHWQTKKNHCPRGHAYDATTTVGNRTMRVCRTCSNAANRRLYHRKKRGQSSESPGYT